MKWWKRVKRRAFFRGLLPSRVYLWLTDKPTETLVVEIHVSKALLEEADNEIVKRLILEDINRVASHTIDARFRNVPT